MKLVLAEKPSVAQSIAKVLGATKREDGYLEGNGYVVSWCVGHLVELSQPELSNLSFVIATSKTCNTKKGVDIFIIPLIITRKKFKKYVVLYPFVRGNSSRINFSLFIYYPSNQFSNTIYRA